MVKQKVLQLIRIILTGNTPRDYEIAGYINLNIKTNDNIFIWGNNAQIYELNQ